MSAAIFKKTVVSFKLPSNSKLILQRGLKETMKTFNSTIATTATTNSTTTTTTTTSSSPSSAAAATTSEKPVLLERRGDKGVIILNRPKALNALNLEMALQLGTQLKSWDSDNQIKMVVIKSASEKAFCAGGDIKQIAGNGAENGKVFFRQEYTLINMIGSLSIPYVALINGIVMGGGCGLSVHGNFRVVTERALFAMPETAIGLFPDVGASHFFHRLPGSLGLYFGLTGQRLSGRDLFKAGIATHFVPSDKIDNLEADLLRLEKPDLLNIDRILQRYQEQWEDDYRKEFSLKPHIGRINSIFGQASSVEDIIAGLTKDNSEWARKHLEILSKTSPTSLKLTFEQLKRSKTMTLPECLKMEYRMACRVLEKPEFYEGVRAMLLDKDNKPKWNPSRLEDVKDSDIQSYFEPLAYSSELQL